MCHCVSLCVTVCHCHCVSLCVTVLQLYLVVSLLYIYIALPAHDRTLTCLRARTLSTHARKNAHTHTLTYTHTYTHTHAHTLTHTNTHTHACTRADMGTKFCLAYKDDKRGLVTDHKSIALRYLRCACMECGITVSSCCEFKHETNTHTHMHTLMHTHTHTCTRKHAHTHTRTHAHANMHTQAHTNTHTGTRTRADMVQAFCV